MKNIVHISSFLLCCLIFHTAVFAQHSRNNNKSSNPYRGQYQRVATGPNSDFSFEIRNGALWAWGNNQFGQLGDGSADNRSTPVRVGSDDNWTIIVTGQFHTIGLKSNGTLWSWGMNAYGQLGDGSYNERHIPTQVGIDKSWTSISASGLHSLALKSDGSLWAWGYNIDGELGDGTNSDRNSPVKIGTDHNWTSIATGYTHSLGLKSDGTLWAWGKNEHGELGNGTMEDKNTPVRIGSDTKWTSISAGTYHTVALQGDGTLWTWGMNANQQLGDGTAINRNAPVRIGTENTWTTLATGGHQTAALKSDGTLWAWGNNNNGELGDGTKTGKKTPVQIGADNKWISIAAGSKHTFGLKSDGSLWAWGKNTDSQLGDGTAAGKNTPVNIQPALNAWITEANGYAHSLAIRGDGTLWAWGNNQFGQLGDSADTDKTTAVQVGIDNKWTSVAIGVTLSFGLKSDGTLWGWGVKGPGEIGDGTKVGKSIPVRIGDETNWVSITTGGYHSLALKSDGSLWAWGNNGNGELGDGSTTHRDAPTKIGNDNQWTSIAAGDKHSIGLKSDGTIWTWGYNYDGELGNGTYYDNNIPTIIGPDTKWTSIAAGDWHSVALKSDGTFWAWGINQEGQLGNGESGQLKDKNIPVQIGTDITWISVAAGSQYTLALKSDGNLWTWGDNVYGQLGDGTNIDKVVPTAITSQGNVVSIAKGSMAYHSAIIKVDRKSICLAGVNYFGDLGDGTNENSNIFKCDNSVCAVMTLTTENTVYENRAISGPGNRTDCQLGCILISSLIPSGSNPVSGYATYKVFIDNTVKTLNGQPYVQRHYDIEPSTNAATATADITLYYTQAEFNAYNAVRGGYLSLPADGADNENYKANISITQYHGQPAGGYNPANYTSGATLITPTSVTWDERNNWWAVRFPVTGFSGFFLHSRTGGALDVSLFRFTAKRTSGVANRLDWTTATEDAGSAFGITRSNDGISFTELSKANGKGNNSNYTYHDEQPLTGTNYYRLKIRSGNDKIFYSDIAIVRNSGGNISIAPVPARNNVTIRNADASFNGRIAIVRDMQGKEVLRFIMAEINHLDISSLATGVYSLHLPSGEVMRIIKQ